MASQPIMFSNFAPEDEEWSAHIKIMNEWQNPERILRDILQYARSGPFHPADMHVDLIDQYIKAQQLQLISEIEEALPEEPETFDSKLPDYDIGVYRGRYDLSAEVRTILATKRGEIES